MKSQMAEQNPSEVFKSFCLTHNEMVVSFKNKFQTQWTWNVFSSVLQKLHVTFSEMYLVAIRKRRHVNNHSANSWITSFTGRPTTLE